LFLQSNGIKCVLYNKIKKKIFLLEGYIENNSIINHSYKNTKIKDFIQINNNLLFSIFLNCLPFSFFLIHDDYNDYLNEFTKYLSFIKKIQNQEIEEIISHFLNLSTYYKKIWIFYLLIDEQNIFCANLAIKLFYTLNSNIHYNTEQISILNVLSISLQNIFKENIIKFHYIPKVELNLLSLEDKIKLIKIDSIKEKAYVKYNELLLKNDESYTKTKTYLDGLLKIPFGIYKKEPILNVMDEIKNDMNFFEEKQRSNLQIYNELSKLLQLNNFEYNEQLLFSYLNSLLKSVLLQFYSMLSNEKKKNKKEIIKDIIFHLKNISFDQLLNLNNEFNIDLNEFIIKNNISFITKATEIKTKIDKIPLYMKNIKSTLDNIIYGQEEAKTHLQMIFSQWINGNQEGYCFGFEGLPGIGKTTLGKGISQCLRKLLSF
jgi:ATP-dependent Lon protease